MSPYVPGQTRLADLADALLASAVATIRPARVPDRQYASAALNPTHDCAQICTYTVPQTAVARTPKGQAPTRGVGAMPNKSGQPSLPFIAWRVQLVQACAPGVTEGVPLNLPETQALAAFGHEMLIDGYDLWRGLLNAQKESTLFGDLVSDCSGAEVGPLTPGGYQGGFAWWSVDIGMLDLDYHSP